MQKKKILPGYPPMKRRQIWITLVVILLALTGVGLIFLIIIDLRVARTGRRLLKKSRTAVPTGPIAGHGTSWLALDCVIVPGAPYHPDGSPGLMLKDRLDSALSLVRAGQARMILISGDHGGDDYDEISVMRRYLIGHGIADEQICCDPAGFDTYETMVRAQQVFLVRQALVTTQTFHLLRALYIGEKLGLNLRGIACDSRRYPWYPVHRLREIIARFKAWLDCEILRAGPMIDSDVTPIKSTISGNSAALDVDRHD